MLRDTKREDWPLMIATIGLTPYKLGLMLGVDPTTVKNWIAGGEPKHCHGVELKRMYEEVTGKTSTISPLCESDAAK